MQASSVDTTFAAHGQDEDMIDVSTSIHQDPGSTEQAFTWQGCRLTVSVLREQREGTRLHSLAIILVGWFS